MSSARCPTCDKTFDPRESRSLPFCSPRCRQIDLRRWLAEEISMPLSELDEESARRRDDRDDDR